MTKKVHDGWMPKYCGIRGQKVVHELQWELVVFDGLSSPLWLRII